jgi:aldose 1-epimerase
MSVMSGRWKCPARFALLALLVFASGSVAVAGQVVENRDIKTGWHVLTITQGPMRVRMVPEAGANVSSINYRNMEVLKPPPTLAELKGYMYGTPIIYPMPNRVRDAQFIFRDRTYKFQPNNGQHFLHGLVHSVPWKYKVSSSPGEVTVDCWYDFAEGTEALKLFPHPHTIRLKVRVTDHAVKFTYTVDNSQGKTDVPFGFALHPWFNYQGSRASTFLTVPATHLMEARELLPTGKLVDLKDSVYDLRQAKSLQGFVIDDVYYGMRPEKPALIEFRDARFNIRLKAGPSFTHMVVYTPENERWFCVENQTCSTDAHNLDQQGKKDVSHLLVVPAGKTASDSAEFHFKTY